MRRSGVFSTVPGFRATWVRYSRVAVAIVVAPYTSLANRRASASPFSLSSLSSKAPTATSHCSPRCPSSLGP